MSDEILVCEKCKIMKHHTRKLVSSPASRHWVKQVTCWSAFLASATADGHSSLLTWTYTSIPWSHWNYSSQSHGDVRIFFLFSCPCAPPFLGPVPFSQFTHSINRFESGPQNTEEQFQQPNIFKECLFWESLLIYISLFMPFKEFAATLANSSPHAEGQGTPPLKEDKSCDSHQCAWKQT